MPTVTVERAMMAFAVMFYDYETMNIPKVFFFSNVPPATTTSSHSSKVVTSWNQDAVMCADVSAHLHVQRNIRPQTLVHVKETTLYSTFESFPHTPECQVDKSVPEQLNLLKLHLVFSS